MKVVLVSGASGFLGRYAVRALVARGYRVHGMSRRPPHDASCVWHAVDVFDTDAVRRVLARVRPSHLLHLAWKTEHGRYWTAPENLRWVEATLSLCRQFHDVGGQWIVGAGTCAEYSWDDTVLRGRPIDEYNTPRQPGHFYGVAKKATFELLTAYCDAVGVGCAWGRVFFPYGAHDRRPTLIPAIIRALQDGQPALCTHGRQQRDFIHARDAGAAFAALLDSGVRGAVNIASGTATSIGEVAHQLGSLLGRPELVRLGALEPRPHEPACLVADIRRLRHEVGYVPAIGLDEGLRETIAWWAQQTPLRMP
jgi:nucleoside-diphosphate-sugar epimerase